VQAKIQGVDNGIKGEEGDKGETGEKERRREEPFPASPRREAMHVPGENSHDEILPLQGARVNIFSISSDAKRDS